MLLDSRNCWEEKCGAGFDGAAVKWCLIVRHVQAANMSKKQVLLCVHTKEFPVILCSGR